MSIRTTFADRFAPRLKAVFITVIGALGGALMTGTEDLTSILSEALTFALSEGEIQIGGFLAAASAAVMAWLDDNLNVGKGTGAKDKVVLDVADLTASKPAAEATSGGPKDAHPE